MSRDRSSSSSFFGRLGIGRQRPLSAWLPAAFALFGLASFFQPMVTEGFGVVPGGPGDTRLVHFSLEHAHRFLDRQPLHRDFWNPPIYYPQRNVAAYTDTLIGFAPFYSPYRWLGASPTTAYQLWLPTMLALTFIVAYQALRRLFGAGRLAASAGAYLFAFAGPRLFNAVHPQMLPWLYWALACLAAGHLLLDPLNGRSAVPEKRRRIWLTVLVAALVGQAYGAFYPFFFFVFLAGLGTLIALTSSDARSRARRLWTDEGPAWALAAATLALLLAPLAKRYLLAAEIVGSRPLESIFHLSPRLMSWWMPPATSHLYGEIWRWPQVLGSPEIFGDRPFAHGLGLVTTVVALIGLWGRRHRPAVRWIAVTAGVLILLATRWPNGASLWVGVYELVPGASAVRVVARFGQCLILPAALGIAFFLDRPAIRKRLWLAVLIVLAMVAEQSQVMRSWNVEQVEGRVDSIVEAIDPGCGAFYLDWSGGRVFEEDAMWAALVSGVPTINGRYGNTPPVWRTMRRKSRNPSPGPPDGALEGWLSHHCVDPLKICRLGIADGSDANLEGEIIRRPPLTVHRGSACVD